MFALQLPLLAESMLVTLYTKLLWQLLVTCVMLWCAGWLSTMCASTALRQSESSGWRKIWARFAAHPPLLFYCSDMECKLHSFGQKRSGRHQGSAGWMVKGLGGEGGGQGGSEMMQLQHLSWQLHILNALNAIYHT